VDCALALAFADKRVAEVVEGRHVARVEPSCLSFIGGRAV
jgi:hypothetical protein